MPKRPSADLSDLHIQMKITNRLLAAGLREKMKQNELVKLLATTGASAREIADVLDTTPATVQVTLGRLRKQTEKNKKSEAEVAEEGG